MKYKSHLSDLEKGVMRESAVLSRVWRALALELSFSTDTTNS